MAISRVRLTLTDDNHGANESDGYKVYRKAGSDPCPGGVIDPANLLETVTGPTTGATVQYTDQTANENTSYHYRASFYRGSDEMLSPIAVGPVSFPSAGDLGYPNNSPSNVSGVANHISTEPFWHFDAAHVFDADGSTFGNRLTAGAPNKADTYSSIKVTPHQNAAVTQWQPTAFDANGTQSTPIPVYEGDSSYHNWSLIHYQSTMIPLTTGRGMDSTDRCIMFDQGLTKFFVGCARINIAYGNTWASSHAYSSNLKSFIWGFSREGTCRNWSDGQVWQNPNPPSWMVNDATLSDQIVPQNQHHESCLQIGKGSRIGDEFGGNAVQFNLTEPDNHRLSIFMIRIMPDGSAKAFVNGNLIFSRVGPMMKPMTADGNRAWPIYPNFYANNNSVFSYGMCARAEEAIIPEASSNEDVLRMQGYALDKFDGYLEPQGNYAGL